MLTAHHTNPCGRRRRKSSLKFAANPPTAVFDRFANPDLLTTSEQNLHFTLSLAGDRLLGSSFVELSLRLDCCTWASMPRKRSWDPWSTRGTIAHPKFLKLSKYGTSSDLNWMPFLPCHIRPYNTGSRKKFVLPRAHYASSYNTIPDSLPRDRSFSRILKSPWILCLSHCWVICNTCFFIKNSPAFFEVEAYRTPEPKMHDCTS